MKSKFLWGSAILCCALGLGTVSCSDDDDKEFSIEETFTKDGIQTAEGGGIYKILVNGNSSWEASSDAKWVNVVVKHGNGGQQAVILVEPKYDGVGREANLIIKSGSDSFKIPVKQVVSRDNASTAMDVAESKGLGFGYNINKYTYTSSTVLNVAAIDLVRQSSVRYRTMMNENYRSELKAENVNADSLENKHDSLGVRISCKISYGTFKFGLSGAIKSGEDRVTNAQRYNLAANYPLYTATVNLPAVLRAYNAWKNEGCPEVNAKGEEDLRGYMIEGEFIDKAEQLEEMVTSGNITAANYKENTNVVNLCSQIVAMFGPAIISQATVGGSYILQCDMDSIWTKEYFGIDQAKVTAAIQTGVFSLEANVEATYERFMKESLKHSSYSILLKGGKLTEQQDVQADFQSGKTFSDKTSLNAWAKGLKIDSGLSNSNVELIDCDVTGIWVLLGTNSQRVMMQYIADNNAFATNDIIKPLLIAEGVIQEETKK